MLQKCCLTALEPRSDRVFNHMCGLTSHRNMLCAPAHNAYIPDPCHGFPYVHDIDRSIYHPLLVGRNMECFCLYHRFLTFFLRRPPAIAVALRDAGLTPALDPSLGVTAPLPGTSEATEPSSSSSIPSVALVPGESRLTTFEIRSETSARNHVFLNDGRTALDSFTGSRLPSGSICKNGQNVVDHVGQNALTMNTSSPSTTMSIIFPPMILPSSSKRGLPPRLTLTCDTRQTASVMEVGRSMLNTNGPSSVLQLVSA
ncbi:unnamed protein product [Somion occarium]|uniref:Uncharacterized protein n=1 Tax=Somion occarium TaxID=3059160 RepID=A0ABP1D107_9APHY